MKKIIFRIITLLTLLLLTVIIYLSTIGIKTNKFNSLIISQIENIEPDIKLKIKDVSVKLNLFTLTVDAKTIGTDLIYRDKTIKLESVKSKILLKSIVNKKFALSQISVSTNSLLVKDFIKFIRIFNKDPKFLIADNFITEGFIVADIKLEFDEFGKIKDNFVINGFVNNGQLSVFNKKINKLNFIFQVTDKKLEFNKFNLSIYNKNLTVPNLVVLKQNNEFFVSGKINNKNLSFKEDDIKNLITNEFWKINIKEITFSSNSDFTFIISKNFKIKKLNINSDINLNNLKLNNFFKFKNIFPEIKKDIIFQNQKIQFNYTKGRIDIIGSGDIYIQKNVDIINYNLTKNKKEIFFDTNLKVSENLFIIDLLNFEKKKKSTLDLSLKGKLMNDRYHINEISILENKNNLLIKDLNLSKNFKINEVGVIKTEYTDKDNLNNQLFIKKYDKDYKITGDNFNLDRIISELLKIKNNNNDIFNKNFQIFFDIKTVYFDKMTFTNNLKGSLFVDNNNITKLNLESEFPDKKKIRFIIKTLENNVKITTLFSHEAKPFVKRYKFIKGFEEGNLDFYSIKKNDVTNSTLKIDNFKIQEIPALAKILTLASLQGIADLLTGEGIRFTDFEMKFSNKGQLMTIEELYAIGPAISILMEGYIQSTELISLRGTLVPATTINRTISSIPLIGDILVGKKVGEGVFGVSFKIKGSPKNLETSVNPIKTLTPRFITRTLEKIKKN